MLEKIKLFYLSRWRELAICLAVLITTVWVYSPVLDYDFVNFDDSEYVYDNVIVQSGVNLNSLIWAFTSFEYANWHPLTWISHMLDCHFFGLDAGMHHLSSVVFHLLNALLVFTLFKTMTGGIWKSALIAALFAMHPLHVESVVWISERKDVLSTFWGLLSILSYTIYAKRNCSTYLTLALVLFLFSLMSKPMLVTLPFLLLVLDYWPLKRYQILDHPGFFHKYLFPNTRLLIEKAPFFILSFSSAMITFLAQHVGEAVRSFEQIPIGERLLNALISYAGYIQKMIWPFNLAIFYPFKSPPSILAAAGSAILLLCISGFALYKSRKGPCIIAGWLWYLGSLVPVIGIIQVGMQSMADRYTYVPLLGLFVMIIWGGEYLGSRWKVAPSMLAFFLLFVIMVLALLSRHQIGFWENGLTLSERAIKVTSGNYLMENNLANVLVRQGDLDKAIPHYLKALEYMPDGSYAYSNLKKTLRAAYPAKSPAQSMAHIVDTYKDSVSLNYTAGKMFKEGKDLEHSILYFRRAIELDNQFVPAYMGLSTSLMLNGELEDSLKVLEQTLLLDPDSPESYYRISRIHEFLHDEEKSSEWYLKALENGYEPADSSVSN